eukprot:CCRYP_007717-RA/>CCRYP_007717-RA protein AED:0.13 eAED:-0.14 QI:0/-1/0/1/-1/1/1/0/394
MRRPQYIRYFLLAHHVIRMESFALVGINLRFRGEIHGGLHLQILNDVHSMDSNSATVVSDNNSTQIFERKRERIPILSYEDNYVIVSKPAGVSMHRNVPRWGHAAKSPALEKLIQKQLSRKPYLVHRLDHRTSGAVIMGFYSQTAAKLHARLRDEEAVKLYVALVRGDLRESFQNAGGNLCGEALSDIMSKASGDATNSMSSKLAKITVDFPIEVGRIQKEAKTDFYFLSSIDLNCPSDEIDYQAELPFTNKALTLLVCRTRTGRTHQIRRHLRKALNSPIIGDSEHGDSRVNRFWKETIGLNRLGLHCWYIELPPMNCGDRVNADDKKTSDDDLIQCIAPLPDDFTNALHHGELKHLWEEALQAEPRLKLAPFDEKGCTFGRHYRRKNNISRG